MAAARSERKLAYVALLRAARQLRYLARIGADADVALADSARTELSTATYEIELLADPLMAKLANGV